MALTRAWTNFKRMEDITVAAAGLIYAAAALRAFQLLPGSTAEVARWTLGWPALYLIASAGLPLMIPAIRRGLARYVWMSFRAGFGQSPGSVLAGVALLLGAALLIYREMGAIAHTGRYPANIFAAYAAGIGILIAQAILVRTLERQPDVRAQIEEP